MGFTSSTGLSTAAPPPLGFWWGGDAGAAVDHAWNLGLVWGAQQVRVNTRGVGQQLGLPGEGVGWSPGREELVGAFLTSFTGEGQDRLVVLQKLLLLLLLLSLLSLLLPVFLHLSDQRVPLTFGHPTKLHRWGEQNVNKNNLKYSCTKQCRRKKEKKRISAFAHNSLLERETRKYWILTELSIFFDGHHGTTVRKITQHNFWINRKGKF